MSTVYQNDMKAEINNENKAKFFALYWGQKVIKDDTCQLLYVSSNINLEHDSWYLNLKPLSSISDEDKNSILEFVEKVIPISETYATVFSIDYLRSKGYALPYLGLSVEDLINAGWIKII